MVRVPKALADHSYMSWSQAITKICEWAENTPITKSLHFSPNQVNTQLTLPTHEEVILTTFHELKATFVMTKFWVSRKFSLYPSIFNLKKHQLHRVVCISTPKMYPRSGYFLICNMYFTSKSVKWSKMKLRKKGVDKSQNMVQITANIRFLQYD